MPTTARTPARWSLVLAVPVALALLLGACTPAGGSLGGRDFLSVSVVENGVDRQLVAGTRIRLSFGDDSLGAQAGCNSIGGSYRIDGGRLLFDGASMTEMGCDPGRHAQDDWLVQFLASGPTVGLAGDELVLQSGGTTIRLLDRRVADPDRPIVGPAWTVVGLIAGGANADAVSSVPGDVVAIFRFAADGTVAVDTGCNQGTGRWSLEGRAMTITDLGLTKRGCAGPAGELEAAIVEALSGGSLQVRIAATSMELRSAGGGLLLEAR